jgi:pantoate--beta-alanine ligase
MRVIRTLVELGKAAADRGRTSGLGGVLVPTMGALHEGHAALIREGANVAARGGPADCVVSIFVNPTQFNQPSDFARYPRSIEADLELCRSSGATVVFAPEVDAVYPPPPAPPIGTPPLPAVATRPGLEDAFRPGHFSGVCQVVLRLFRLLGPEAAVFGEKDWQQLQVVTAMTREAGLRVAIVPCATVRDADGLAKSSRNRFLSNAEREQALAIPRALEAARARAVPAKAEAAMHAVLAGTALRVEYAVVRDPVSLGPIAPGASAGRALIAAWAGSTRLIDNGAWR